MQKTLQSQIKGTAEIKAEAGKEETRERRANRGGKERKMVAESKDGAERNQLLRKVGEQRDANEDANEDANATAKEKPKRVRGTREASIKEEPPRTNPTAKASGRGRGKLPAARNPLKKGAGGSSGRGQRSADGGEGPPDAGLRRSKRIASRK